jgi:hypothetical protein
VCLLAFALAAGSGRAAQEQVALDVAAVEVVDRAGFETPNLPPGADARAQSGADSRRFRQTVTDAVRAVLQPRGDSLRAIVVLETARLAYLTPPRPRRPLVGVRGPGGQETFVAEIAGAVRIADGDRVLARQPLATRKIHTVQLTPGTADWPAAMATLAGAAAADVRSALVATVRAHWPMLVRGAPDRPRAGDTGAWVELCNDLRRRAPRLAYDFEALGLCE